MTLKDSPAVQQALKWQQGCVDTAEEGLAAQAAQLRALGILDENNRPVSKELPDDMQPHSRTDTTAL